MSQRPDFSALRLRCSDWRTVGQWVTLCCVLVAIALGGVTSTLVGVLGSIHTHGPATANELSPLLEDFRRLDPIHLAAPHPHEHSHLSLERHQHDAADASVQAVDAVAEGWSDAAAASAAAGALMLTFCATSLWLPLARIATPMRWRVLRCQPLSSGHGHPLERPPRR